MSQNDIEKARLDMEKAHAVDFWSHVDAKQSVLTASRGSMAVDENYDRITGYGKIARNAIAICDQKVAG